MNIVLPRHSTAVGTAQSSINRSVEHFFATGRVEAGKRSESMDPAERLEFTTLPKENVARFDRRKDSELREEMFSHPSAVERERAAWELADRLGSESLATIHAFANTDASREVRESALWLLQKIAGNRARDHLAHFTADPDREIADWAHMLTREITGVTSPEMPVRKAKFNDNNVFDQTLPLKIAGFARTLVPGMGWVQATLSPLWFEMLMGRVMACTCINTFGSDLIIEKRMKAFHLDGGDHYEIYKFRGVTFEPVDHLTHHIYEGISRHTFYTSGKVEDCINGEAIGDVIVSAARAAEPVMVTRPLQIDGSPRARQVAAKAVESVRGRYYGFGYVSVPRLLNNSMTLGPGEVQLTDVHHPVVGPLTNTFIWGTFKGKLADHSGDGILDLNTARCHATLQGALDYRLTGAANPDPFDPLGLV